MSRIGFPCHAREVHVPEGVRDPGWLVGRYGIPQNAMTAGRKPQWDRTPIRCPLCDGALVTTDTPHERVTQLSDDGRIGYMEPMPPGLVFLGCSQCAVGFSTERERLPARGDGA